MWKKYFKKNKFTGGFTHTLTLKGSKKLVCGFTIIETMIAISIFLIVVVIGTGALLNAHLINKKSQDMRSIMDSLSFSMEDMSRNIRTGYNYHCIEGEDFSSLETPKSCINGDGIAFEYSDGDISDPTDQWVYYIQDGKLFRSTDGFSSSTQMTPDEVTLNDGIYNFSVIGAELASKDDVQQPLVIIRLVGTITSGGNTTPFSLQTAVSQRLNDI